MRWVLQTALLPTLYPLVPECLAQDGRRRMPGVKESVRIGPSEG
jgi:hypothetical protein